MAKLTQMPVDEAMGTNDNSQNKTVTIIHKRTPQPPPPAPSFVERVTPNRMSSRQGTLFALVLLTVGLMFTDKIRRSWTALFSDKKSGGLTVQNTEKVFLEFISLGFILAIIIAIGDTQLYPVAFGIVLIALVYTAMKPNSTALQTWVSLVNSAGKNIKGSDTKK